MAFVPASSIAPATVTVSGTVQADVTDRAARLVGVVSVSGTVPVSAASLPLPDGAATEDTLADVKEALNDVALTAILHREQIETAA